MSCRSHREQERERERVSVLLGVPVHRLSIELYVSAMCIKHCVHLEIIVSFVLSFFLLACMLMHDDRRRRRYPAVPPD